MKYIVIVVFILFFLLNASGQDKGSITATGQYARAGTPIVYVYHPPRRLHVPALAFASLVYSINEKYYFAKIPVHKERGILQFTFKAPDSAQALVISINDSNDVIIDNNGGSGFVTYFGKDEKNVTPAACLNAAYLLSYYAPKVLKLDRGKANDSEFEIYEKVYTLAPALREQDPYNYYLFLLYRKYGDSVKPKLLSYAKEMSGAISDEKKWMNALYMYRILGMKKEYDSVEKKTLDAFPTGKVARDRFMNEFGNQTAYTEASILESMKNYVSRFHDTSDQMQYTFYMAMIGALITNREWNKLDKYEALLDYNQNVLNNYNGVALKMCNAAKSETDSNLFIAKALSKKSLNYTERKISQLKADQQDGLLQTAYYKYLETYASILYKLQQFDSAFYYQQIVYTHQKQPGTETVERYALYAEKTRNPQFVYDFIRQQVMTGISSPALLEQLKSAGKRSGIADSNYNNVSVNAVKLAAEKMSQTVRQKYGSVKAKDFMLKDLAGQSVSLTSLKGKTVILDFWATWCGPCVASFPGMQNTMNLYKNDSNVVFLYINSFEHDNANEVRTKVARFINGNKYPFQVLLDENNKVAAAYKVETIPARFIIDKIGNIVFMGETADLGRQIENVKHL